MIYIILGQKPHECKKCGKRFALGCNMKAHMKTHENPATKFNIDLYSATDERDGNIGIEEQEEEMDGEINVEETSEVHC